MEIRKMFLMMGMLALSVSTSMVYGKDKSALSKINAPYLRVVPSMMVSSENPFDKLFLFNNFPINQEFILHVERPFVDKTFSEEVRLVINEDYSITANNQEPSYFFGLNTSRYFKAERLHIKCSYPDGKLIMEMDYTPSPYHFESKEGTFSVDAELFMIVPATYKLTYKGLKNGEIFHYRSISENEVIERDVPFNPNVIYSMSPDVVGKKEGKAAIKVTRASGDALEFELPWGIMLIDTLSKEDAGLIRASLKE